MTDEPKVEEVRTVTIEEAKVLMAQEKKNRGMACNQEIQMVLAKYNCSFVAIPIISPEGIIKAQMQLIPKD